MTPDSGRCFYAWSKARTGGLVLALAALLGLGGLAGAAFGLYAMLRGGRDSNAGAPGDHGASGDKGGLGPIPERGIHFLAGLRIFIFGGICLAAAAFALWTQLS